jgi:adenosine deaminase
MLQVSAEESALRRQIAAMPKAEIHVHLEGATGPRTWFEIAERNRVALPAVTLDDWKHYFRFKSFQHFIDVYITATQAVRKPEDVVEMIERLHERQAAQWIRYTECFISASLHLRYLGPDELLDAIEEGIRVGRARTGATIRFIADISRESPDTQFAVGKMAIRGHERGLILGIGLGGLEAQFPPELFTQTYRKARDAGLHVVAHAGEAAGAASIRAAVSELSAERIGHGVRVLEDPSLVAELRERGTVFEVCPRSNYALGIVAPDEPHPIHAMVRAGLRCTVNSDDPAMFAGDLIDEYVTLGRQGCTFDDLMALNRSTLEATFLAADEKALLRAEWDAFAAALAH